jgi:hypothetical protein
MNRSAINAEVQYQLKRQELERKRHVVEMDEKKSFLHRLLAMVTGRWFTDASEPRHAGAGSSKPARYHEQKRSAAP